MRPVLMVIACLSFVAGGLPRAVVGTEDEPAPRVSWSPSRSGDAQVTGSSVRAKRKRTAASEDSGTVVAQYTGDAPTARLERPLVLSPRQDSVVTMSVPGAGAVYVDEQGHATTGPAGSCSCGNPWCPECRSRFGGPSATGQTWFWPPRFSGFWVRPEYLYWWTEAMDAPPLVTAGGTGVLGAAGTTVQYGGELNDDWRSGGRLSGGIWLNPWQTTGIDGSAFLLTEEKSTFSANGTAAARLGRPFFNIQTPGEDARLVPAAGFASGTISAEATTDLHGGELMLRQLAGSTARSRSAILVGYRYLRLDDDLRINDFQADAAGTTTLARTDAFDSENTFHGVNIGWITEMRFNRLTGEFTMKVALGSTTSQVRINGSTTSVSPGGGTTTSVGGLLAQSSNSGTFEDDEFAVVPELAAVVGFNITERLKATAGYTFIYWSRVARSAEQIDRDLNLPAVPGPNTLRPEFAFRWSDFWAQGANVGLEFSY